MPYKSSGFTIRSSDKFKRPYENNKNPTVRHAKTMATLDSRPGNKSTIYKSNQMYKNYLTKLKKIGNIPKMSKPLPKNRTGVVLLD